MTTPLVSVIIVSYNTRDLTVQAIKSVHSSTKVDPQLVEIIVVDNHSSDDTVKYLRQHYPQVKVIANQDNVGFGAGNNQAAAVAKGKYLLLLNSDAMLYPNSLVKLITSLEADNSIIAIGPKYEYQDHSFQQSAGYFPTVSRVIGWMWGLDKIPLIKQFFATPYHLYDAKAYSISHQVDWLMGACVLISREEYLKVSGFDEHIFMYSEEIELFLRLHSQTDKHCYYLSDSLITHIGSASTKKAGATRLVHELSGIEYIYRKHYPHLLWLIRFILYTGVIMRLAIFSLIPSRKDAVVEYKKFFKRS